MFSSVSKRRVKKKKRPDEMEMDRKVLEKLESKYTCLFAPSSSGSTFLTPLSVFVFKQPLSSPFSLLNLLDDQNVIDEQKIKEKISHALSNMRFRDPHVLVQFWAPVTLWKRCFLTTLDQPFGLGVVDEPLYLHRLKSEQCMFAVDGELREDIGPPARAYRQKLPEWSLDVSPVRQSAQDLAFCYTTHGYIDLPVFEPDRHCCVGVLEIITLTKHTDYAFEVQEVSRVLKEENLKCPNLFEDYSLYDGDGDRNIQNELDEIYIALKSICNAQNIPLAQTWTLCGYSSVVANSGNLEQSCSSYNRHCFGKECMTTYGLPFYVQDLAMWGFHEACTQRHLYKSQGVVGRSFASCGTCLCEDVTKLGEDEHPLGFYARISGIPSCLAIYLKSIERDVEYVVELVLPPHNTNEADLQSLVKTAKLHLKNVSSVELGNMSSILVIGGDPNRAGASGGVIVAAMTLLTEEEILKDDVCCICLAEYANNDEVRWLPCTHLFHKDCVDEWLKINASCPLCKSEVGENALGSLTEPTANSCWCAIIARCFSFS